MVAIAISGIQNPGNLGAIARVLKNFDIKELYLINPECSPLDQEARNRAKHAQDILESIKIGRTRNYRFNPLVSDWRVPTF